MCAYVQANTNGRLHSASEPSISPLNRGFLYGDAIYEVWRSYEGVLFAWDEHWERLEKSAESLFFPVVFSREHILEEIKRTVAAFRETTRSSAEIYVRLQISRGGGNIGLDTQLADKPEFVLLVQENKLYTEQKFKQGLTLSIARTLKRNHPDSLNPAWKTGNYLNNILCLREARGRGADEVVICNQAGELTEAAVSNIAFVKDGCVITPPLDAGILAGVTRRILLEKVAPVLGVQVEQRAVLPSELRTMHECFLLSSTKDVTPVAAIDEVGFTHGEGTLTYRLKQGFAEYVKAYIAAHPELRVFAP